MAPRTPYSADLGDRDPLEAIRENSRRLRSLTGGWTDAEFERTYAPGKWTARQILIHLAQTEMALGTRARMALSTPGYVAQPFDQDKWLARETRLTGADAIEALAALSRMNHMLFEELTPADRAISMAHPEFGAITVDWILHMLAGHQIHHLEQIATIA